MIKIQGLKKSFGSGLGSVEVLKGIELNIGQGERVAIIGASGAGKTTLMHILGCLDRPTSGEVLINEVSVFSKSMNIDSFRNKHIGFVFQFHQLLPEFTALENVMMPALISRKSKKEALSIASGLIESVGLKEREDHRPGQLSGGEQQRVAIARALASNPSILLADEPTGNLDSTTSEEIVSLLDTIHSKYNMTQILVTHSEKVASRMDRVIEMADGYIV